MLPLAGRSLRTSSSMIVVPVVGMGWGVMVKAIVVVIITILKIMIIIMSRCVKPYRKLFSNS